MSEPATSAMPVDLLARALEATGALVAGVRADQWDAPTPCADWSVRDLVNHVVGGNHLFASILDGGQLPGPEQAARMRGADHLDGDAVAAYRRASSVLQDAFCQPDLMERMFPSPIGTVPAIVLLHLRITEILVHGWDLARATAQPALLPDDLAEQELQFTRGKLGDVPAGRSPFAPPQPVADDAPAIDRLAACLGRGVAADGTETARA